MANMFNEDGTYNKTDWKTGDRITANKLNKIEDSLEAINNNDIARHVEADARLDALEEGRESYETEVNNSLDAMEDRVQDNIDAANLELYQVKSNMTILEQEMNEGITEVNNIANTVDDKLSQAETNMNNRLFTLETNVNNKISEAEIDLQNQIVQGKADMEAMVAEVEGSLNDIQTNADNIATLRNERIWKRITGLVSNDESAATNNRQILTSWMGAKGKNAIIPPGTFYIDQPIYYTKECHIEGCGWTYGGTCIVPLGDFSAFVPDPNQNIDFTRNTFKNFRIDGKNVDTAVGGIEFSNSFLTNVEDVFFHNSGCSFIHSDSIMFNLCKFMDYDINQSCVAVDIGTGSRSIHFNECNFEIGTSAGRARIFVDSEYACTMQLINSQFERANVLIRKGKNVVIRDCKGEDLYIGLSPKTAFCTIQDVNCPSIIHDFGHRNRIINYRGLGTHYGVTTDIKIDEHSSMIPASGNIWKSTNGKELLFITAICPTNNTSLVDAGLIFKDAGTGQELARTYTTNVPVNLSSSIGYNRISFNNFFTLVKPGENGITIEKTSSAGDTGYMRFVYENLLANGTFSNNTSIEGWTKRYPDGYTSVTHTGGVSTKITTGDGTNAGGIYQGVNIKANHTYMLLCSYKSGMVGFGQMWDGTIGARVSAAYHKIVPDPEMDGFYLASAYYTALSNTGVNISIGDINPANTTEVRWVALIDITDWGIKSLG